MKRIIFVSILLSVLISFGSCSIFKRASDVKNIVPVAKPIAKNVRDTVKISNVPFFTTDQLCAEIRKYDSIGSSCIEIVMTNPTEGWFIEGNTMSLINSSKKIYKANFYKHSEFETILTLADSCGVSVVPVFDFTKDDPYFRKVTGHSTLSVEGVRFAYALLDEFLSETGFERIIIYARVSSQLNSLKRLSKKYPEITIEFIP